jgi:cyclase
MANSKTLRGVRLGTAVAMLVASVAAGQPAAPQAAPPVAPITSQLVKANVYAVMGGVGGGAGFVVGKTGVIAIDSKITAEAGTQMLALIAKATSKPVTHVILTHSDIDHVGGLSAFPAGVTIVAHAGNKKEMEEALAAGGRGAPPADRMPTRIVTGTTETMTIDGVKVELYHWAPAHTNGDLVVYFPESKVAFTGDITATNRPDPNIKPEKGGSTLGWLASAQQIVLLDADLYVPGHGDVQTRAFIDNKARDLAERRKKVEALTMQGKSLAEVKAALNDHGQTPGQVPALTWVEATFKELTGKRGGS